MPYLPDVQHDIFVSYARVDDLTFTDGEKGWVSMLVSCIRIRLAQLLGRADAFSLWMDHELSKHESVTQQVLDAVSRSAVIVIVLSPGYLASDWCRREKQCFLEQIKHAPGSRFFVVEREPVNDQDKPVEFKDLLGFKFWDREADGKASRILGFPTPTADDRKFYAVLDDLTKELVNELKNLKRKASSNLVDPFGAKIECETSDSSDSRRPTVFLAEVTDDLEHERSSVKRYLDQLDTATVPETWYSQEPGSFRQSVERDLSRSVLFVQLLSGCAGKKPPDLPEGYLRLQLDIARTMGKPIFQWRSPALEVADIKDEEHLSLVTGDTVRAEGMEDFKQAIRDALAKLKAPQRQDVERRSLNAFVFVNMETTDRPLAEKICGYLEQNGIGYSLPLMEGEPAESRRDLEQNLLECNGVIIIYGKSTVSWVRHHLRELRKIVSQRTTGLPVIAVFDGPPENKNLLDMKLPYLQVLSSRKGFDTKTLDRFLGEIQQEA